MTGKLVIQPCRIYLKKEEGFQQKVLPENGTNAGV
jgi:hypothetical protein